jgi:general secretion pathway protein A
MYTAFYGLREKPFQLSPDPRFLFLAESHREALAHLMFGIEQGEGFIAITGEVGTGKTTLCRTLLQRIEPGTEVAFIFNPQLSATELLEAINMELGLESAGRSRRELMDDLNRFLLEKKRGSRRVLLIVDEAQNLEADALEQIRMLSNLETETSKLIQIILLGQPELDAMLESPSLRQLRQRISVRWRLKPLSARETAEYVRHRLRIAAGANRELFTEVALREIHRRSAGIPRLINLLADRALLAGYGVEARTIGVPLVSQAERELRGGSHSPALRQPGRTRRPRLGSAAAALALFVAGFLSVLMWQRAGLSGSVAELLPLLGLDRVVATQAAREPAVARVGDLQGVAAAEPVRPAANPRPPAPAQPARPPERIEPLALRPASPAGNVEAAGQAGSRDLPVAAALQPESALVLARAAQETPRAGPVEVAKTRVQPARRTPRVTPPSRVVPGVDDVLAGVSSGSATAAALDALLGTWNLPPSGAASLSVQAAVAELRARGLQVHAVGLPDTAKLVSMNHPAITSLRASDGSLRPVLVRSVGSDTARIAAIRAGGPSVEIPRREFDARVEGNAWVAWRDFELLPPLIVPGHTGPAVEWLQTSLAMLGYFSAPINGNFDGATIGAVRAFQSSRGLHVDGTVGPRTKMALYGELEGYPIPRLNEESREGMG